MLPETINVLNSEHSTPFRPKVPNVSQSFPKQHGQVHYSNIHSWAPTSVLPWFLLPWFKHYPKPTWGGMDIFQFTCYSLSVTKSSFWRNRFIIFHTCTSQTTPEGSQGRWSKQEPGGRDWSRDHGWILLTGFAHMAFSACFLIHPKNASPGVAQSTIG